MPEFAIVPSYAVLTPGSPMDRERSGTYTYPNAYDTETRIMLLEYAVTLPRVAAELVDKFPAELGFLLSNRLIDYGFHNLVGHGLTEVGLLGMCENWADRGLQIPFPGTMVPTGCKTRRHPVSMFSLLEPATDEPILPPNWKDAVAVRGDVGWVWKGPLVTNGYETHWAKFNETTATPK